MTKGWMTYGGNKSIPVEILNPEEIGQRYQRTIKVRFFTRKMGLKGHVGRVVREALSFTPPHLT